MPVSRGKSQVYRRRGRDDSYKEVRFPDANLFGLAYRIKNPDGINSTFWVQHIRKCRPCFVKAGQTIHQSVRGHFLTTCCVVIYVDAMSGFPVVCLGELCRLLHQCHLRSMDILFSTFPSEAILHCNRSFNLIIVCIGDYISMFVGVVSAAHQLFCYSSPGLDGQPEEVMYR